MWNKDSNRTFMVNTLKINDTPMDFTKKDITIDRFNDIEIKIKSANFAKVSGKEVLLDEELVNRRIEKIVNAIDGTTTKYNLKPKRVILEMDDNHSESSCNNDLKTSSEHNNLGSIYSPNWTFDEIGISNEKKQKIITTLAIEKYKDILFNEWGIKGNTSNGRAVCLNFWGKPGTGKSITAEAIASYLRKKIINVNYSELESKFVGETPKNIKKVFDIADKHNAVLVFDEADSFLGKRLTNVSQSADYGVNITRSVMLMELERFSGVVIFTTNLINNYDEAFKRRILANIEFELPNEKERSSIWKSHITNKIPKEESLTIDYLSKEFKNISGADIKDMTLYAATNALIQERNFLCRDDFKYAYEFILDRYKKEEKVEVVHERITKKQYEDEIKELSNDR